MQSETRRSPPFPLIRDLPSKLHGEGWSWEPFTSKPINHKDFWIGQAPDGTRWLVKMRGSFAAWREHTFAALAQELGLSCQSSTFLKLRSSAAPMVNAKDVEENQLAIWLMPEHRSDTCAAASCSASQLNAALANLASDPAQALIGSNILFVQDWVRGEVLGYFCGSGECGQILITCDHELILIDNEQAFSSSPANLDTCSWLFPKSRHVSQPGLVLALDIARRFSKISDEILRRLVALPSGYRVQRLWGLAPKLRAARAAAGKFVRSYG